MSYVMGLDVSDVIELIDIAIEKREEAKAWDMWLARYQRMDKTTFVPFSRFYQKAISAEISNKSTEDILSEVEAIRKRAKPQMG